MEVGIKDKTYRIDRLNAMDQAKVFKRLGPVALAVLGTLSTIGNIVIPAEPATSGENADLQIDLEKLCRKTIMAFSAMPDDDMQYIFSACLSKVKLKSGNAWHDIMRDGQIMYDDIELLDMMYLSFLVVEDDLLNFIRGLGTLLITAG